MSDTVQKALRFCLYMPCETNNGVKQFGYVNGVYPIPIQSLGLESIDSTVHDEIIKYKSAVLMDEVPDQTSQRIVIEYLIYYLLSPLITPNENKPDENVTKWIEGLLSTNSVRDLEDIIKDMEQWGLSEII